MNWMYGKRESQIQARQTQSAFYQREQRNAFRRLLQKRLPFCALIYIVIFGARSMAKATALVVTLAFLTSCGGPEVWIPQGNSRPAVTREHVQYLDSPPQRPYRVIGIITPPSREYETLAEAVKAIRKEAAKHGADAVYVESQVTFRAKAIVWEPSSSPSPFTSSATKPMFPTAKAVPGKPGYVFSPFDTKGRYIDVRGYPPGSKAKDPWTDKIFIVP